MQPLINHIIKPVKKQLSKAALIFMVLCGCMHTVSAQQFNYNFDSLKRVINQRPNDTASIIAYIDYAARFFYMKSDSGLYYLDKATALARTKPDNYLYLYALKNRADYYSISGDFKTAAKIYKQALATKSGLQSWLLKVKLRGNLGIAYKNMGQLDSALMCYQEVGRLFATHKNTHRDSLAMAFSYMQLYDLYQVQGLMDEALYYGQKGYELSLPLKAERGIAYGLYIQALKHKNTNPQLALSYARKALAMATDKNIPELKDFTHSLIAKIFIGQKKYKEAEQELLQNLQYTAGSVRQVTYSHLAEVYYHLGNYPKALWNFNQSYKMATTSSYHAELAAALVNGIAIHQKLGNYKEAFYLQKEYQQVQEQIASDKLKLDYQRSALRFKTAEKDKQLAQKQLLIAQKDNRLNRQSLLMGISGGIIILAIALWFFHQRQQQKLEQQQAIAREAAREVQTLEAMMRGEETERVRIAKDLHDGIGGLLSAVKMRFSTVKNEYPDLKASASYQQAINMLDDASADVRKTAHNLMPDMLTRFGLDEAVQVFCSNVSMRNELVVNYQSVGQIGRYHDSFELAIYRIVQELVNNIIKHANAHEALVQFTRQDNVLTISIEDDGVGFDLNPKTSTGMGLNSVKSRVQALNGLIDIDSAPGRGTAIYLEFDVSHLIKNTHP